MKTIYIIYDTDIAFTKKEDFLKFCKHSQEKESNLCETYENEFFKINVYNSFEEFLENTWQNKKNMILYN